MRKLATTTALAPVLAASLTVAQTTPPATTMPPPPADLVVSEGFGRRATQVTAEDLPGAAIHDSTGASIGEVHDLVFAPSATDSAPSTTMPLTGGTMGTTCSTSTDGTSGGMGGSSTDSTTGSTTGTTTGADSTTGTTPGATGTTADGTGSAAGTTGTAGKMEEIFRAILDIGGFLGRGEHRIAVPVADMFIHRSDSALRVYRHWARDQLQALPAHDADDPAMPGRSLWRP